MAWRDEAWARWAIAILAAAAATLVLIGAAILVTRVLGLEYRVAWGTALPFVLIGAWFLEWGWRSDRDARRAARGRADDAAADDPPDVRRHG
jgi:hypothetical protein